MEKLLHITCDLPMESLVREFPLDPETGITNGILDHISHRNTGGSDKWAYSNRVVIRNRTLKD